MGLFGKRTNIVRAGTLQEREAVETFLKDQARNLERDIRDTPTEYLVLQAASMLFTAEIGSVDPKITLGTLEFTLDNGRMGPSTDSAIEATLNILALHQCTVHATPELHQRTREIADTFFRAVQRGQVTGLQLTAGLDDLLNFYEGHLPPRTNPQSKSQATSQPTFWQRLLGKRESDDAK